MDSERRAIAIRAQFHSFCAYKYWDREWFLEAKANAISFSSDYEGYLSIFCSEVLLHDNDMYMSIMRALNAALP